MRLRTRSALFGLATAIVVTTAMVPVGASTPAATTGGSWSSAGHDTAGTRSNPDEHLISAANVATLVPGWTKTFTNNLTATPAVVNGAVFVGDRGGSLTALNASSGAVIWSHTVTSYTGYANDSTRGTPAVSDGRVVFANRAGGGSAGGSRLLAVSTGGILLWNTVVDAQKNGYITGAPLIDGNTAYIGISSYDEGSANCCTTRGAVVAVDVRTGKLLWKTFTIPLGYTGASVWGSPVVSHSTGLLYVGTGENHSVPAGVCTHPGQTSCTPVAATDYFDSLLALNLSTGRITWAMRTLDADVSQNVCNPAIVCGPDFDFGSSPNLYSAQIGGVSRQLVGIGQKSGVYWGVDAVTGKVVWQTQVGPGAKAGGIVWGSATDGTRIYVSIVNADKQNYVLQPSGVSTTGGAFSALDPATGRILWQTADPQGVGDLGFVSVANGVVYAGSEAGTGTSMYGLDATTGAITWRFASGGSVMGGAAIVNGTVYWESGYYTKICPPSQPTCGTTYRLYTFHLPS